MQTVRTRFAPSPTGFLHVGAVRTAVFAWLVARQNKGKFILRLEDTDKKREVAGSDKHLMDSLRALGLDYDEGPDIGGPHAPYRQSERLSSYKNWAQKLIESDRAYADPYTPEEVQAFRDQAQKDKKAFLYRAHRPESAGSAGQRRTEPWDGSKPLRFKSDPKPYKWQDAIMGDLSAGPEVIDDFILIKSDGFPTYNFAHIIDDEEMEITHIIRGQEFIASVPNYLNLYEALGLRPPIMATVPHILGQDGKKKLSKRDDAKDVLDYLREGFLPEALINFIASLGWNDGTEQEIYSIDELIKKFSLQRVQHSGAHFDEHRLAWMNGTHIRQLKIDDLYKMTVAEGASSKEQVVRNFWPKEADNYPESYKKQVLGLVQERLKYFAELPGLTDFFFTDLPVKPDLITGNKQLGKISMNEIKNWLTEARASIEKSDFNAKDLAERLNLLLEQTGQKPGVLFSLIRIATTQSPASPGLAETLSVLGKETTLRRIDQTIKALAS